MLERGRVRRHRRGRAAARHGLLGDARERAQALAGLPRAQRHRQPGRDAAPVVAGGLARGARERRRLRADLPADVPRPEPARAAVRPARGVDARARERAVRDRRRPARRRPPAGQGRLRPRLDAAARGHAQHERGRRHERPRARRRRPTSSSAPRCSPRPSRGRSSSSARYQKIEAGARFFQTQAVIDIDKFARAAEALTPTGAKLIAGVLLLQEPARHQLHQRAARRPDGPRADRATASPAPRTRSRRRSRSPPSRSASCARSPTACTSCRWGPTTRWCGSSRTRGSPSRARRARHASSSPLLCHVAITPSSSSRTDATSLGFSTSISAGMAPAPKLGVAGEGELAVLRVDEHRRGVRRCGSR